MHYKLSNTASLKTIENGTGLSFNYPNIYKPQHIISGQTERIIPIITQTNPNIIQFGIWGLLPQGYEGDWYKFQGIKSTLATSKSAIELSKALYNDALNKRRCVIVATGYFTYYLNDNEIVEHLIEAKKDELFYIAGIFNVLDDGFLTFSLLETKAPDTINNAQNLNNTMPLHISKLMINEWLNPETSIEDFEKMVEEQSPSEYKIH